MTCSRFIAPRRPSPTAGIDNLPTPSDAAEASSSIIDPPRDLPADRIYSPDNFRQGPTQKLQERVSTTNKSPAFSRVAVAAAFTALIFAAPTSASSTYARYFVDALYVSNGIESQGVRYEGRKVAIDNAACMGLRRYGVQTSDYGLDKFWRFRCTLNGADNHSYDVQISTTAGPRPRFVYPHYLSLRRLY